MGGKTPVGGAAGVKSGGSGTGAARLERGVRIRKERRGERRRGRMVDGLVACGGRHLRWWWNADTRWGGGRL